MRLILEWVLHFGRSCWTAFFANRMASYITAQHVIAVGDVLQGEALELLAHNTMPIYDADFQEVAG